MALLDSTAISEPTQQLQLVTAQLTGGLILLVLFVLSVLLMRQFGKWLRGRLRQGPVSPSDPTDIWLRHKLPDDWQAWVSRGRREPGSTDLPRRGRD